MVLDLTWVQCFNLYGCYTTMVAFLGCALIIYVDEALWSTFSIHKTTWCHITTDKKYFWVRPLERSVYKWVYSTQSHVLCFTGSELKSWLLYYSMPILRGILPLVYLAHYSLLVASLHMLSSHCVSASDMDAAEVYLNTFYRSSVLLYGTHICTIHPICSCV